MSYDCVGSSQAERLDTTPKLAGSSKARVTRKQGDIERCGDGQLFPSVTQLRLIVSRIPGIRRVRGGGGKITCTWNAKYRLENGDVVRRLNRMPKDFAGPI